MVRPGTVSAHPARLVAYHRATAPAARRLADVLTDVPAAVAAWNARPSAYGGRVDGDRMATLAAAAAGSVALDAWVARIGGAFAVADRSGAGSPPGASLPFHPGAACPVDPDGPFFDVVRDGSDGRTRVVRLTLDHLPTTMTPDRWQHLLTQVGLVGPPGSTAGPVHLVVHGWGMTTAGAAGAGLETADLHDRAVGAAGSGAGGTGRAATVLVVDWDAGRGTGGGWRRAPGDFRRAEASSRATGDALAEVLTALAAVDPDVPVAVSAHSLGNEVAARALSRMEDPSGRFSVDYLAIQAAIPARAPVEDPEHYGALAGARVRDLTVTINASDDVLFWYELQGPEALGDETIDGAGITALRERRQEAGVATRVVDHDGEAGGGHLGLRPGPAQPLVRDLTEAMIERVG